MGRTVTPKYVVEASGFHFHLDAMAWDGRATEKRLEDWRQAMNRSFAEPDGANSHIRLRDGGIPHLSKAWIRHNWPNGAVVVEVNAPMFEVV